MFILAEKEELFDNKDHGVKAHERARGPKKLVVIPKITHYGVYREARAQAREHSRRQAADFRHLSLHSCEGRRRPSTSDRTSCAAATDRLRLRVRPGIGMPKWTSAAATASGLSPACSLPTISTAGRAKSRSSSVAADPGMAA